MTVQSQGQKNDEFSILVQFHAAQKSGAEVNKFKNPFKRYLPNTNIDTYNSLNIRETTRYSYRENIREIIKDIIVKIQYSHLSTTYLVCEI